jgi:hypothetical protein
MSNVIKKLTLFLLIGLFFFFLGIITTYQFPQTIDKAKVYIAGLNQIIFPDKRDKPILIDKAKKTSETIYANSFAISVDQIDYVSFKNIEKPKQLELQHRSSALYAQKINGETLLKYFTRDGHEISKNNIKRYDLPRTYDAHNSHGGIRGVFYFEDEPYAYMVSKSIGCQYVAIIDLNLSSEIFKAGCLPDYRGIHYFGIGGASIHLKDKILLSMGTPTSTSQSIRDFAQNINSYYGKITAINKNDLKKTKTNKQLLKPDIFSLGHRNIQGLAIIDDIIFSSEHGPKGGDEINLIKPKNNYGWPTSSYGTIYETIDKKYYDYSHSKHGFNEPIFQFTPSIALSSLAKCTKQMMNYFERKGCLIATSLKAKSLIIILLNDDLNRIIGYERIQFNERLRHFANDFKGNLFSEEDGSIYVSTDNLRVLKLKFNFKKSTIGQ